MTTLTLFPAFNRHGERLHGKFVAALDGRQLCVSRQPLLDAARVLLAEGVDPETPIATRHAGAGFDAMASTVGAAARWTVREDETTSPTFVRWKPFPARGYGRPCVLTAGRHQTPGKAPAPPVAAPASGGRSREPGTAAKGRE